MFSWKTFLGELRNNIFGIVNVTNDSFTGDGILGKTESINQIYKKAEQKDIQFLDIGCQSTKPNFRPISTKEEMKRFNSFLEVKKDSFSFSIDTFNPVIAQRALENGFYAVNDVSGAQNSEMLKIVKDYSAGIIIVHRNPASSFIHEKVNYKNIISDVKNDLRIQIKDVLESGIGKEKIAIEKSFEMVKQTCTSKIDESIDVSLRINTKQSKGGDFNLRTVVKLPNGNGKKYKIAVLSPEKLKFSPLTFGLVNL